MIPTGEREREREREGARERDREREKKEKNEGVGRHKNNFFCNIKSCISLRDPCLNNVNIVNLFFK